ncbi:MAG: hypothetical protein UV57_C0009G0007 [Parcubacteria group bacterium GW2011_GWD2_43_10]|uniref:EamA domain-containing protein n=5 Tax=Candidatus Vebleniibacteriota TaxID=1817921 RepID=A0A1G2Q6M2_9BACT|nr:MAG: hypothetical protein UV47_C0036G0003 [Parcubacteria group bacterium GW2011_GWA2_42_80]KKS78969.1 MAG: hypothetical protein UV52_C0021G0007 [Parcubacteria group bacterium GW2011_GWD1_42_9]KKS83651.1 MAG: hypothetical protein UV57_C0009G0007 [Parcubacteria group bacterium GW2011_GWD2_43_10]KKS93121.1 MAG: hypothetical protein UV69_C0013G0009 [Parcubacteria group bacterium GW2011_GWE2_43_12]KKT12861.1 MAG: hypothetical protein UV92_C0023G0003 [Parcubacteria group bacterium GW2011_GWA1_43_2
MSVKISSAVSLALSAAVISGLANFFNKVGITVVSDAVLYTFIKNGLVAIIFLAILVLSTRWREIKQLNKGDWVKLMAIGAIGGSLPFILFFTGLAMTSAVSASLIHKTLFIWVALLAMPFLGERLGKIQWAALGLLLFGNFFLGSWQQLTLGKGELLILAATLLWAVENIIAKRALQNISSLLVASARMVLGSALILLVVLVQGKAGLISNLSYEQWSWAILAAGLLFGYVICWYSALKSAPASIVASLLVPASLVTSLLSLIFLDKSLTGAEIISSILVILAIGIIIWSGRKFSRSASYAEAGNN